MHTIPELIYLFMTGFVLLNSTVIIYQKGILLHPSLLHWFLIGVVGCFSIGGMLLYSALFFI